jgi:prolipoprotein diacylglyceryltransferase
MYPVIRIFSLEIPSYHLMIAIGLLAAGVVRLVFPLKNEHQERAAWILAPAAAGLIIGAKLPVILSYGWRPEFLVTGRSLLGGLLGTWLAVRIAKGIRGQHWSGGGDAYVLPLATGIAFGRVGCLLNGCCWGRNGFPAPALEILFHVTAFGVFLVFSRKRMFEGDWFQIYLLAYCVFRFAMEFIRVEPRVLGQLTVYHLLALAGMVALTLDLRRRLQECA